MGRKPEGTEAGAALARLHEARISAAAAHREAADRERALAGQIRYLDEVTARFVRRRDHLLAAAEASPPESRQAAELAGTAERLRQGVEYVRRGLTAPRGEAEARVQQAEAVLTRIDTAANRLTDAMKSLELVRLEQANRERLAELERTGFARLQQPGQPSPPPAAGPLAGSSSVHFQAHVREVNRLAYEAEALADLQRERLR